MSSLKQIGLGMPLSANSLTFSNKAKIDLQAEPTGAAKDKAEMDSAARQFEGVLMQQMLKGMWETVPQGGMLSGSKEEEYYRDMLNEALAESISSGQGIGIRDVLVRDMERIQSKQNGPIK